MTDEMTLTPLSTCSTQELVDELKRRSDGGVCGYVRNQGQGVETFSGAYWGSLTLAIGALERLRGDLMHESVFGGEDVEGDAE